MKSKTSISQWYRKWLFRFGSLFWFKHWNTVFKSYDPDHKHTLNGCIINIVVAFLSKTPHYFSVFSWRKLKVLLNLFWSNFCWNGHISGYNRCTRRGTRRHFSFFEYFKSAKRKTRTAQKQREKLNRFLRYKTVNFTNILFISSDSDNKGAVQRSWWTR